VREPGAARFATGVAFAAFFSGSGGGGGTI
jgi:hypothetical protein